MQRGDLVTVSLQGDYGKPRPALIVQSDLLTDLESVVLCPVTSDLRNAAFRVTVEPNPANGCAHYRKLWWTSSRRYRAPKSVNRLAASTMSE